MKEFFPQIDNIQYEGKDSTDPMAFQHYDPNEKVGDATMAEHLRFSVAYWHTFRGRGSDPFGSGTMQRPWDEVKDPMEKAKTRAKAAFEFIDELGLDYFCFHDRDIAPAGDSLVETNANLDEMVSLIEELMKEKEVELLWGTANLFEHPRYAHGAATAPESDVFAYVLLP
ncbi:xylose isomerase, partial [Candidatus Bipolaricaulota bacterium]|nr:xylose isomerase [Candidatus Bipolaricaulota bacterium]